MSTALKAATSEPVTAPVQFTRKDHVTPVALVHQEGQGPDDRTGTFEWRDIVIHDARPMVDQLDLDRQGYALMRHETAVKDLFDDDAVRRAYYPEMDALLKQATGASKVVIFDHTPRIDDTAAQGANKVRGPATIVHNDFTPESAAQRVRDLLPADEAEARLAKRYGSINVWRPIRGPVENAPLMICGWDDIADEDLPTRCVVRRPSCTMISRPSPRPSGCATCCQRMRRKRASPSVTARSMCGGRSAARWKTRR